MLSAPTADRLEEALEVTDDAYLTHLGALLGNLALGAEIRSFMVHEAPGLDAAALAELQAGLGASVRLSAAAPGLPATLAVRVAPLAEVPEIEAFATSLMGMTLSAEVRIALRTTAELLTTLLGEAPFINAIDTLTDQLSRHLKQRCLVEAVNSLPSAPAQQILVLKVL